MLLGERFQVRSEFVGLFSEDPASNFSRVFFSLGMHYLMTLNAEVGLRLGRGLTEQSSSFFANAGFGVHCLLDLHSSRPALRAYGHDVAYHPNGAPTVGMAAAAE